jgi:hypothetical protein
MLYKFQAFMSMVHVVQFKMSLQTIFSPVFMGSRVQPWGAMVPVEGPRMAETRPIKLFVRLYYFFRGQARGAKLNEPLSLARGSLL